MKELIDEQKDKEDLTIPFSELIDRRGWDWLCINRILSEEFIEEWIENFTVLRLLENQSLSLELSLKIRDIVHVKCLKSRIHHVLSEISSKELKNIIKLIARDLRDRFSQDGIVTYELTFSGPIGKEIFDKYIKDRNILVKTDNFEKRIKIVHNFNSEIKTNAFTFNLMKTPNLQLQKIYII